MRVQVHVGGELLRAGVDLEDRPALLEPRAVDDDVLVEAPRPQQRGVEDVRPVRGRHDDQFLVRLEAVHLGQQLVEGLLALVVPAAEAGAARAADGVDLVDEDDARLGRLGLLHHVAHPGGADADEHLDELRGVDAEERHAGLARRGARQQRLAGAGGADQQHAARHPRADRRELLRVLEEVDDLAQLDLDVVHAGDVREGDLLPGRLGEEPRLALPERKEPPRAAADALGRPAHDQHPHRDDQDPGQHPDDEPPQSDSCSGLPTLIRTLCSRSVPISVSP